MEEKNWLNKILSIIFIQEGKTYVGMSTALTFVCLVADSLWDKWKTPEWWTQAPFGVYCIILITFASSKLIELWTNSKYNSPQGTPPANQ